MIIEMVEMDVKPGTEAAFEAAIGRSVEYFKQAKGCTSVRMMRAIEAPNRFRFFVEWQTLENHTEDFRGSPGHVAMKDLIAPYVERSAPPEHHRVVLNEGFPPS